MCQPNNEERDVSDFNHCNSIIVCFICFFDIAQNAVGLLHHMRIIMLEYNDSPKIAFSSAVESFGAVMIGKVYGGYATSSVHGICSSWIVILILLVGVLFVIPSAIECFIMDFCNENNVC